MNKLDFIKHIAESAGIPANMADVHKFLRISYQAVQQWPDVITIRIANSVIGDFVRLGKRPPKQIVDFVRGVK